MNPKQERRSDDPNNLPVIIERFPFPCLFSPYSRVKNAFSVLISSRVGGTHT